MEEQLKLFEEPTCALCFHLYPTTQVDKWVCNEPNSQCYSDYVDPEQITCKCYFHWRNK